MTPPRLTRPPLGPAARRPSARRPGNAARPAALRLQAPAAADEPADPLARDAALARLEAVLLMADEPLAAKRLAEVVGLADAADARRGVARLRAAYDADGSAFQVEGSPAATSS